MNYAEIKYNDIANGTGVRTSLFVSGCNHHCKGCFNAITWDFNYGKKLTNELIESILDSIDLPHIQGLSIIGGEPLDPKNQPTVAKIVNKFRDRFGRDKDIWLYTGYTVDDVIINKDIWYGVDVIVDGAFVEELKDITLKFRGSSNQRIIDVPASIVANDIILCEEMM